MNKPKEICDSAFTLDDLIQESVEMNNFLKGKTNQSYHNGNHFENLSRFFTNEMKLRNAKKNICWEKSNLQNSVRMFLNNIFLRLIISIFWI